jgi:mycofactocin biosynthetic radical S-adenosylmethionine protein MftC
MKLVEHFQYGLNSPICLTRELTHACNLACVHCLSSSGRRDPRELSTDECTARSGPTSRSASRLCAKP